MKKNVTGHSPKATGPMQAQTMKMLWSRKRVHSEKNWE